MTEVRSATERDLAPVLAIYNHAIEHTTAVFSYEPHTLEMRREWFKAKQASRNPVLVAEHDGRIAGFATYGSFRQWPAYSHTVEHSVYTAPEFRRRGIARLLMTELIASARSNGLHAMVGGVVAENAESVRLHESLGFTEVAHFREVGWKFGRWLDLKFFELLLQPAPQDGSGAGLPEERSGI
ncbi:MAG TPA: GNAT family N-acetyltransferase [Gemmatimonadaceae bacterium]|nr:GNAT family N-acetyltransferase [Gemmatimonadaceae bacterium]